MNTIKVPEATELQLDWIVAKCEDKNGVLHDDGITRCIVIAAPSGVYKGRYTPTVNWAHGGPIIEGEHLQSHWAGPVLGYAAMHPDCKKYSYGPTMLIAAMRCFVASRLGDEVTVPEALL